MKNKTVIITGANGNLGTVAVRKFNELGANVVAVSRGAKADDVDDTVYVIENCDLVNTEQVQNIISQTTSHFAKPDILINVAGGFMWKKIKDTLLEDFNDQFDLNFTTMYNMTMAALPSLEQSIAGRIINIGAIGALSAGSGMAAYASSKSAVMRFTEALASETKDSLTVNAIMPSIIDTPQNRKDMPDADASKWVTAAELVDVMVFLSSNKASGVNGVLMPVTGRL